MMLSVARNTRVKAMGMPIQMMARVYRGRTVATTSARAAAAPATETTPSSSTSNPAKPVPEWSNESADEHTRAVSSPSRSRRQRRSDWPLTAVDSFFRDPFHFGDSLFLSPLSSSSSSSPSFPSRQPLARHWLGPLQSLLGGTTSNTSGPALAPTATANTMAQTMNHPLLGAFHNVLASAMAPFEDVSRGVWNWEAELLNPVRMELDEADSKYVMRVRVPGMSKNDLHVRAEPSGYLHLWGEHVDESNNQERREKRTEPPEGTERGADGHTKRASGDVESADARSSSTRSSMSFERWIAIPDSVYVGGIHAKFENDALFISLPKTEGARQAQKAEIAIE